MLNLFSFTSNCSIRPSSTGTWSFFGRFGLLLRLDNPGSALIDCRCFARQRTPSWGLWVLPRLGWLLLFPKSDWKASLLLAFVLWSLRPIGRLVIPRVIRLLPPLIGLWWSLAMIGLLLFSVHWPEDDLGMNFFSFLCLGLSKTTWIHGYRNGVHCLKWSSWVSRTCRQYFSIQNSVPLLLWSLLMLPLRPTLWSS